MAERLAELKAKFMHNLNATPPIIFMSQAWIGDDGKARFPLAFGLVPQDKRKGVAGFLSIKGMACSVYAAQYIMEALFLNGAADKAMELISANSDRSWKHIVETGTAKHEVK